MKPHFKFNIHVVEDHNDALHGIYKDIGGKRLSFSNLTMIHFDSHPDLGIPSDLVADQIMNKDKLFDSLSIENWILPAVFAGHIRQVIWIRPHWAKQIKNGLFNIVLGKNVRTGKIQCNCNEPYFLGDDLYTNEINLVNTKNLALYVCDFEAIVNNLDTKLLEMIVGKDRNIILDIDLDHFSTRDPFREMFKANDEYEMYKRVYALDLPSYSEDDFESKYEAYLLKKKVKLESIWSCLNGGQHNEMEGSDLLKLKGLIEEYGLDAEILHSFGSGIDDCPLPHHISSDDEILAMMDQFEKFLNTYLRLCDGSSVPGCVTVARSSLDDYCPVDQVDFIQNECLNRLKRHFGSERINSIEFLYETN